LNIGVRGNDFLKIFDVTKGKKGEGEKHPKKRKEARTRDYAVYAGRGGEKKVISGGVDSVKEREEEKRDVASYCEVVGKTLKASFRGGGGVGTPCLVQEGDFFKQERKRKRK